MKKLLRIIRILVLALLGTLAIRPVITLHDDNATKGWAVLIDQSRSMRVIDPVKRIDQAKAITETILKHVKDADVFAFAKSLEAMKPADMTHVEANGVTTNGGEAIEACFKKKQYDGAFVITDGRFLGKVDPVSTASRIGRPLFVIGVGDKSLFKDVSVDRVQAPPFAFKNIPTTITAALSVRGFAGRSLPVKLKESGKIISLQSLDIKSNDVQTTLSFSWTPENLGAHVLTVEAGVFVGEVTPLNNQKEITIDVGRDRFRVLYISGDPGPEYGFLRHQFKSDPGVELVTFVILRNNTNVLNIPEQELSLIPFPTQDALLSQMASFDLVVFEEFPYWVYGLSPGMLEAIHRRVVQGGSFLIMGGQTVFGPGSGYNIPSIEDMIPFKFGDSPVPTVAGPLPLTVKTLLHPIFRVAQNDKQNEEIWKNAPPLEDVALLSGVKPDTSVLASVRVNGVEHPVLAVGRLGKGRVAALSCRTTWRWAMLDGKKGYEPTLYQTFWKNMVLWLTHSAEYNTVRVALEGKIIKYGDTSTARVWVYDDYFKPLEADVHIRVVDSNKKETLLKAVSESKGVTSAEVPVLEPGNYTVEAWVTRDGKKYGQDSTAFRVTENQAEEEDLRPDFETLKEMASVSDGQFVSAPEFDPALVKGFVKSAEEKQGRKFLLWDSSWLFGAIMFLILLEWSLRKWKDWL